MSTADATRRPEDATSPARRRERIERLPGLVVELGLVAVFALAYFGIRALTQGSVPQAFANAEALVDLQGRMGIAWEEAIHGVVAGREHLVTLVNWVYIYGHWPVIVTALVVLYLRAPRRYPLLRNAIFISGVIGMVVFALLPMAPPRFGVLDVVDTVSERSQGYRALQPPSLTNKYAAMPSLHFGWNLLVGIVLWQATRRPLARAFAVAMPAAMAVAVIATANHYVLDVAGGGAVALAGYVVARRFPDVLPVAGRLREAR